MKTYKLSNQAIGAIMMTLQKGILEQVDITEILQDFQLVELQNGKLNVDNPPIFQLQKVEEPETSA